MLSRGVRWVMAASGVALYVLVYLNAGRLLPPAVFRDAQKIQEQMDGAQTYAGSSFDAASRFFLSFGAGVDALVLGAGIWLVWSIAMRADRVRLLIPALALAAPCVFFNLFVAGKDTLVVLMSLMVAASASRGNAVVRTWILTVVLYLAYAVTLRAYFALILGVAMVFYLLICVGCRSRIVVIASAIWAMACLPPAVFLALQYPRDLAVDYLMFQSPYGARTSFYNPFRPDSLSAFSANYLYAACRLNFAVLWIPGAKELAMQCWVLVAAWPPAVQVVCAMRYRARGVRSLLACLVLAHVAVSMLFEPDLGSYMRHLSSVAALSMLLLKSGRA